MKMNIRKLHSAGVFILLMITGLLVSCEERSNFDEDLPTTLNIIQSAKVGETAATIDDLSGIINFVLPSGTNPQAVELVFTAPEGVEIFPASGSTVDLTSPLEVTAKVGNNTRHYIINARVLPNQVAFIGNAATIDGIEEDDIKAAALWTQETYGSDFIYIPYSDLTIEALHSVNVLFFFYDNVGSSALPEDIIAKRNVLTQFVAEGGKMLLGGMGTTLASVIGRDQSGLLTIRDNGVGSVNPDTWQIDGGVNFQNDQRSHPIYNFTETIPTDPSGYFPIINPGFKENHNNLWDLAPLLGPGHQVGQFAEFENLYGGKVLAVWSGVTDECCPGIIEFKPTSVYTGTIIAIGAGGMEWNMNDGRVNTYAGVIRGIYRNSIDYLRTR
ncbi:DUF4960 domain-containing protein [Flavobacterium sp. Sd200]|uniref:DUF4960 domain-containing protein n=1 Tax=Flavobacterium sp. Sd200 TaxID=2692211 RepID=UPI001368CECE|nr:DUF4960 domain-containing protein [Flavobacterium sp. Sd200]MXN91671.1 DUF4960 domain-containing protein [Flavobacterium sp. Sd200]